MAKFGGILEAFEYGAPPHGGIALGIDRWAALLTDQTNIREVMAFPKTSSGTDLMLDAPSPVERRSSTSWGSSSSPGPDPRGSRPVGRPADRSGRRRVGGQRRAFERSVVGFLGGRRAPLRCRRDGT